MDPKQQENLAFFRSKLPELLDDPFLRHKFVVVHGGEIKAAFDGFEAALCEAVARYPRNEFIVQQVIGDREIVNFIRAA